MPVGVWEQLLYVGLFWCQGPRARTTVPGAGNPKSGPPAGCEGVSARPLVSGGLRVVGACTSRFLSAGLSLQISPLSKAAGDKVEGPP